MDLLGTSWRPQAAFSKGLAPSFANKRVICHGSEFCDGSGQRNDTLLPSMSEFVIPAPPETSPQLKSG